MTRLGITYPDLFVILIFIHNIDCLLDITQHKVAMTVVSLQMIMVSPRVLRQQRWHALGWARGAVSYMKPSFQFSIASKLHENHFVQKEPN